MKRKIYLASSWRNQDQPRILKFLRQEGHEVYDFRNPARDDDGFSWSDIDPDWKDWKPFEFKAALRDPIAHHGFAADHRAMIWADTCVLLLPSGRSAHTEAGWFSGQGKPVFVLMEKAGEPELMYKLFDYIATSPINLLRILNNWE